MDGLRIRAFPLPRLSCHQVYKRKKPVGETPTGFVYYRSATYMPTGSTRPKVTWVEVMMPSMISGL